MPVAYPAGVGAIHGARDTLPGAMFSRLADLATRRHRRIVVLAVVLAVLAGVLGGNVASRLNPYSAHDAATDTYKAAHAIEHATGLEPRPRIVALVRDQSRT